MNQPQAQQPQFGSFLDYLVTHQYIDPNILSDIFHKKTANESAPLIHYLIQQKLIPAKELAIAESHYYTMPLLDLDAIDLNHIPEHLLDSDMVRKYQGLPLYIKKNQLYLAVADPTQPNLNEIKFHTGLNPVLVIVEADKLINTINQILNAKLTSTYSNLEEDELETIDVNEQDTLDFDLASTDVEDNQAPIVRFVYKILLQAVNKHASDIHFEPYEKYYRIRFRQDGILYEITKPPLKIAHYLVARLKIMANLDISERRLPQDGRFRITFLETRPIDFRISTCPTLYGEKVALRVLDNAGSLQDVETLGMNDQQQQLFQNVIHKSQGMVLVTGPTGSGKTTTLYAALNEINTTEKNLCTVEDPIEINLQGINQVPVNLKTTLTFSKALRAFLRQDPDIIMVGEIRDLETAEVSVRAAQTGHLVLSTLHTNSAAETLVRLANMGIPSYNIASSITLIVAQRLVRKLCDHCKKEASIPEKALIEAGFDKNEANNLKVYTPTGCEQCTQGYQGRVAFFEILPISKIMSELIMNNASSLQIAQLAQKEGHINLRQAGLAKVKQGLTSLEEINRII